MSTLLVPLSEEPDTRRQSAWFFFLGFAAYLVALVIPDIAFLAVDVSKGSTDGDGTLWTLALIEMLLLCAAAVFVALGAWKTGASAARRRVGAVLGAAYLLVPILGLTLIYLQGFAVSGLVVMASPMHLFVLAAYSEPLLWIQLVVSALLAVALFLAWAIARPLRGPGIFGLVLGFVTVPVVIAVFLIVTPSPLDWPLPTLLFWAPPLVAVLTALAFERKK